MEDMEQRLLFCWDLHTKFIHDLIKMLAFSQYNVTTQFAFEATSLDNESQKEVLERIGETEESRKQCLQTLRTSLQELHDIEPCLDERFLLKFLRVSKFDSEKALERIKRFYKTQEKLLTSLKSDSIPLTVVRSTPYVFALPYRCKDYSAICVVKMGAVDYSKISFEERFFLDILAIEKLLENPTTQMCGVTIILDFSGFKLSSLLVINPRIVIDYVSDIQNTFPLRVKEFHIINAPSVFRILYQMCYPAMSKKTRNRLLIHPKDDDWKSLLSCIPREILPEEFGGVLPQTSGMNLIGNVEEMENRFCEQLKFGCVKSKQQRMSMKLIAPDR
ncbi:clavesin-2 [Caerostris darwini]|uniref:Clavesin-2 n=1 Tax=Caerostris darwini TaxID=1538125 RepID=A0AAV4R316_9ARAC|nr:clavesin-2 [Caerostris darwini]